MKKFIFSLILLSLVGCSSHKEIAVVVDKPIVPVYTPAEVQPPTITLFITKDKDNNTLYSFDENNFIKLKKFLLDITRNNEFTREIVCYYNRDICELKVLVSEKSSKK